MGIVTIATLALNSQSLTSRTSVLEQADLVYASLSTLYIAAQHWWWWPAPGQDDATYVHAFDITQPNSVNYLGSGVVNGTPQNQYSFDEWNGNLRVATQLANRVADPANGPWGDVVNASQVSVLTLDGGTLVNTGTSVPVAQGDTLFASRFVGSRGFLVASRQVDPLITFDLTDPTHPTKVAELGVSGFSSFLYPIDDTHLLAVGELSTGDDVSVQLQLTLFDVADLSAPSVVSQVLVGQGYASSQALWDPKALTWFPDKKLLALPFVDWQPAVDWSGFISDLRLFTVDTTAGITPAGSLSMADVYESTGNQSWSYYWSPLVTRSILADNAVYAISNAGIRSALVPNLPNWLATVRFTPAPAQPVRATGRDAQKARLMVVARSVPPRDVGVRLPGGAGLPGRAPGVPDGTGDEHQPAAPSPAGGGVTVATGATPSTNDEQLATQANVQGEFPAQFILRLYHPAPEAARQPLRTGEVRFARANAAVLPVGVATVNAAFSDVSSIAYALDTLHWFLYLEQDVPENSLTAWWLGGALPAGYHLLNVLATSPQCLQPAQVASCAAALVQLGVPDVPPGAGEATDFCLASYRLQPASFDEGITLQIGGPETPTASPCP